jgi:hypothetical protein
MALCQEGRPLKRNRQGYDLDMLRLPQFPMRQSAIVLEFAACLSLSVSAQQYDIVINHGRVMDPESVRSSG